MGGLCRCGDPVVQLWVEPTRPPQPLPSKAPPPPPEPTKPKKGPGGKRKSFELSSSLSSDHALPRGKGKEVMGKQHQQQQKRCEEPPSLKGDEPPDPLLGA